ncbi:Kunitz/Bovine pancreatic trypsin inhibitor domain protein [Ancylostoma ceylanicum]|nr:Kunitz/Bovine pancreatic trypsin inhibitor domain protein [Ancylostoma ceylanicum]
MNALDSRCSMPVDSGKECDKPMGIRYVFVKPRGKCMAMEYGGCGGNKNNFKTLSECEKTCS